MICYNCGLKLNTGDEEECQLCGAKFTVKCLSCGFPNSSFSRYCFNCGSKLAKQEEAHIAQDPDTLTESRKNVAVIFADVSGFTSLSEKKDPEEVREIINNCFRYITRPVYEMEGTIDKYIGDCVMILFGAKYPHSDDARRAVACALRMMELVRSFSEDALSAENIALNLSIGINYGLVVLGNVGNYFDKDYTVMGDIVNTAQRLQSNAGAGTILVSESVYTETKDIFLYTQAREITVKNRETPIRCHTPLSFRADHSVGDDLPLTEREREMSLLNSLYNENLNTGTSCIRITGEAGIGKTRLIREFVSRLDGNLKKIYICCSPMHRQRTYHMISCILMEIMNINLRDNASMKQHRLISFLDYTLQGYSEEEVKRCSDFLGLVLGVNRDLEFQNILHSMNAEGVKREIFKQLSIFITSLCKRKRMIIVADDIHWADAYSLQILHELVSSLPDTGVLFILSSRYETGEFAAGEGSRFHSIKLSPISRQNLSKLAGKLLGCARMEKSLLDAIEKFTRGNPLYLKELLSNIKSAGRYYIRGNTAYIAKGGLDSLPGNIQSLILSNLSGMDDLTRNALQAASVIGREFTLSLIGSILDCDLDTPGFLSQSVQLNIISLKSVYTHSGAVEKVYLFNHDIEREAIYDTILNKNKKEYHRKIAEYIELHHSKNLENYYEDLCVHFEKAGLLKKAGEYSYKTALKYRENFNPTTSLEYYNKFLKLSVRKKSLESGGKVTAAFMDMGHIYLKMGNYDLAMQYLNRALAAASLSEDIYRIKLTIADVYKDKGAISEALAVLNEIEPRIRQNSSLYGRLLQMKCNILRLQGSSEALSIARKSEKILLKTRDYYNLSETMKHAGIIYFSRGDIDNALFFMNKSYKYAEKVDNLESMAKVSGDMGIIYHSTGMISKAFEYFNRSMELSQKISYYRGYIAACINLGILHLDKGLFDKAESLFKESLGSSREISSQLYECNSLANLGDTMYEKGFWDEACRYYEQSLAVARKINIPIEEGVNYIGLSKLYIKLGAQDKASGLLEGARRIFEAAGEVTYMMDYHILKGLCRLIENKPEEAAGYCKNAIELASESRNHKKKLKALRLKARILMQQGHCQKACEYAAESVRLSELLESDYESAKSCYLQYRILHALDRPSESAESLSRAEEYISRTDPCRWTEIIRRRLPV